MELLSPKVNCVVAVSEFSPPVLIGKNSHDAISSERRLFNPFSASLMYRADVDFVVKASSAAGEYSVLADVATRIASSIFPTFANCCCGVGAVFIAIELFVLIAMY